MDNTPTAAPAVPAPSRVQMTISVRSEHQEMLANMSPAVLDAMLDRRKAEEAKQLYAQIGVAVRALPIEQQRALYASLPKPAKVLPPPPVPRPAPRAPAPVAPAAPAGPANPPAGS